MFGFGKKPGPLLGLDINSSTISVIQIEKTKTDSRVSKFLSIPTPPDIVREGLLADPEGIGTAVRELLDQAGIPNKKPIPIVNVGIPGQAVVIRLMPVPTGMPNDELADVVKQEAINNLPFPLEEANIDFCLLPATERTDPDGVRRVDVLLAAIQRIVVDSYWRMAETANIQLGRLDISSLSVIRALACAGQLTDDGQMTMAVNIRNDATDITLIKKGMPLFSRSVLLGVETLGEAISRSIDAPMDEALSLLPSIQLGSVPTADPRIGQAAQVARSVFGDLTAEVGRSLEFYMSQVGAVQVDQIILTGPGCVVPGIHEFVSNRLNIQAVVADPFTNLIYDQAMIPDEMRASYSMLVGLVADSAASPLKSVEVDLNKQGRSDGPAREVGEEGEEEYEEEVDTPWFVPVLAGGIGIMLICVLVWAALAFYFNSGKESEIAALDQTIEDSKRKVDQMEKTQGELAGLREKRMVLEKIVRHGEPRTLMLKLLKETVPEGVQMSQCQLTDDKMSLNCISVDFTKASHFAINLEGSNMLDDVKLNDIHRTKKSPAQVVFSMEGTIKPDAATIDPDEYKFEPPHLDESVADATNANILFAGGGKRPGAKKVLSKPIVYYFFSLHNPICKLFGPQYDQMKAQFGSQADFQTVDFDDPNAIGLLTQYKVTTAPDLVVVNLEGEGNHVVGKSPSLALQAELSKISKVAGSTPPTK